MGGEWARYQAARTAKEVADNLDKEIRCAKQEERRVAEERAAEERAAYTTEGPVVIMPLWYAVPWYTIPHGLHIAT
jgi:hypothetical protein